MRGIYKVVLPCIAIAMCENSESLVFRPVTFGTLAANTS